MTNNSNIRNKVIFISVIFIVACILVGSVTLMVLHHFHSAFADTEKCQTCKGSGQVSVSVPCSACNGEGKIGNVKTCVGCNGNGTITTSCDACGGSGMVETPCSVCGGSGMISGGMDEQGNPIEEPCGCGGGMVVEPCGACGGSGSFSETCGGCSGNGIIDERPTCEVCSGSGSVLSQILCSDCNGTGDAFFSVEFTLPDQTKVTKRINSLTSDIIQEVWNTSDLMKNHYELKGFYLYKNGTQIPSSEVTLPYSIVEDGYTVLLAAKTYTVTWNLNLPSGVTDWYLAGSQGENLQTSTQSYESLACLDSQTYSGDSVPPPCAGAILGIGFLDPNMSGALPEGCNFLGWATDPEGTNIVFSFFGFDLELTSDNKHYYKPTSRLETPYYITADTTFYAVYDYQEPTSTLSFPQVSDCYFRYKIGDGDWVTDYSSYSYTESSLPFTVTTEITKMNVVDKLWRGFRAGTAPMNMPTNFTPVFTYTIDSFEDLTFSPIFEESCRISFSSSTNYDFEFKINGNGISIAPTDWISVSSAVGQNYLFTRGNVVSIRNIDILSLGLILDKFTFSSNPTDSSGNSLFQVITAVDPNDGAEYYLSTNPNVSEDLVSTSVTLALKNFTIDVWPLFSFDEYDSFSGLPVVSSFKSDNLSHPILSFPFELEDLGTVLYNQYTNKLNTFDIPYWVFEDGSLVTFPLTLESAVKHKSLFPYVKGLKSHPYSMSIEGFAVNAYSNVKAYIVYQNLTDNTPVQPSYGLVTSSGASNPLIALRSPLYYTDAEDIYLCVTKSYNPYIEISYNGTIIYSEQVAKYSATSSDADFYPLKNAIEKANTLFGSASEARDKLLTLQYISFSFKDVGTSQASQHIVLHFDETNVWQPNLMDSFSFFETIFKGVVSALDVYIAPNITLLSILSVVLAIGILLFIFRMSGII